MRYFAEHSNMLRIVDAIACQKYMVDHTEEAIYCAHFGCGKVLTMTEQLYGTKCQEHSVQPKQDITKHINY